MIFIRKSDFHHRQLTVGFLNLPADGRPYQRVDNTVHPLPHGRIPKNKISHLRSVDGSVFPKNLITIYLSLIHI